MFIPRSAHFETYQAERRQGKLRSKKASYEYQLAAMSEQINTARKPFARGTNWSKTCVQRSVNSSQLHYKPT